MPQASAEGGARRSRAGGGHTSENQRSPASSNMRFPTASKIIRRRISTERRTRMIISHKHKFIFIKTPKAAGTSVEAFFAPLLGDADVISRAQDGETIYYPDANIPKEWTRPTMTAMRREIKEGHNVKDIGRLLITWSERDLYKKHLNLLQGLKHCLQRASRRYFFAVPPEEDAIEHLMASELQILLPKNFWNRYTIFGVIRNPWDRATSLYHFLRRHENDRARSMTAQGFEQFVHYIRVTAESDPDWRMDSDALPRPDPALSNDGWIWPKACRPAMRFLQGADGDSVATDIARFENLNEDLSRICEKLNIPWPGQLKPRLRSKTGTKQDYRDLYTDYAKEVIRILYAADIEHIGYEF